MPTVQYVCFDIDQIRSVVVAGTDKDFDTIVKYKDGQQDALWFQTQEEAQAMVDSIIMQVKAFKHSDTCTPPTDTPISIADGPEEIVDQTITPHELPFKYTIHGLAERVLDSPVGLKNDRYPPLQPRFDDRPTAILWDDPLELADDSNTEGSHDDGNAFYLHDGAISSEVKGVLKSICSDYTERMQAGSNSKMGMVLCGTLDKDKLQDVEQANAADLKFAADRGTTPGPDITFDPVVVLKQQIGEVVDHRSDYTDDAYQKLINSLRSQIQALETAASTGSEREEEKQ